MNIWKILPAVALLTLPLASRADDTNTVTTPAPVIPEAAREHFVMGTTLYSNATSVADFKQAADEFQQAADLAPQWSKPRYNLAWAKEAAEDYAGAIADLKRYQQFNLPEAEARAVQDKIYVIKAKLAKAEKKKAEEQKVVNAERGEKAKREEYLNSLVGRWELHSGNFTYHFVIARRDGGELFDVFYGCKINSTAQDYSHACENIKMDGDVLKFRVSAGGDGWHEYAVRIDSQGNLSGAHVFWDSKAGEYLSDTKSENIYNRQPQ